MEQRLSVESKVQFAALIPSHRLEEVLPLMEIMDMSCNMRTVLARPGKNGGRCNITRKFRNRQQGGFEGLDQALVTNRFLPC